MSEPGPLPPDSPFADWDEELYQKTCAALDQPEAPGSRIAAWFWLAVTLGLFVLSFVWQTELVVLGLIVVVLLLHEAGHFAGMWAFGYRNVRMFFIPFFGAAVSGKKHAAPVWQQAIVLLLGPLPGIFLALGLVLALPADSRPNRLILWLVVINALNLLPLVPLDGGRLLDALLFSRRPILAVSFQVLAAVGLGGLALLGGLKSWPLWLVAALVALGIPFRYRKAQREAAFAGNPWCFPERIEELEDGQRRELFGWAILLNPLERTPHPLAASMRELHEHMVARRPGHWVLAGLVLLYLAGWSASIVVLVRR